MATITVRTDAQVEEALSRLTADGRTSSEAVRAAILAAAREQYYAEMQADAERVAHDPDDLAEMRRVAAEMDEISAW